MNTLALTSTYSDYGDDTRDTANLDQKLVTITSETSEYPIMGTGFIIGEHEIMTAAHCLTSLQMEFYKPTVEILKTNPSNGNTIKLTPLFMTVPDKYYDDDEYNYTYDYAIIKVKEDLSSYGKVFLGLGLNDELLDTPLHALGYALTNNKMPILKISHGELTSYSNNGYICSIPAYPGTSGGPLYVESRFGIKNPTDPDEMIKTYKTVIGVINGVGHDDRNDEDITAVARITPNILKFAYDNPNV